MGEVKQEVRSVEVTYVCDSCGKGMVEKAGDMDPVSGEIAHACMICGQEQVFKWKYYPRIEHIPIDDKF